MSKTLGSTERCPVTPSDRVTRELVGATLTHVALHNAHQGIEDA